jgi:hypothetical protein
MGLRERKIQRLSRVLKFIFLVAACSLPILNAGFWITNGYSFLKPWMNWDLIPKIDGAVIKPLEEMDNVIKLFAFLVSLIPTSINVFIFVLLAKLFRSFESLEIFSGQNVKYLRKIGGCIFLNQLLYPVYFGLLSLTLTISNPPGFRMISMAFGTQQVTLLIVGAMIMLISWIVEEGRILREEQAATI